MSPALRLPPQAPLGLPRLLLQGTEPVLILHVRRKGRHLGIALADQLGVDHEVPDIDVGEQALVQVPGLHVEFEADGLPRDQPVIGGVCLRAEGLDASLRMLGLRSVDADVAHPDRAAVQVHVDRVRRHRGTKGYGEEPRFRSEPREREFPRVAICHKAFDPLSFEVEPPVPSRCDQQFLVGDDRHQRPSEDENGGFNLAF
jgi:hypothetical protein